MTKRFFNPYVPKGYYKGIQGKKVLVVGASLYCDHEDCAHYNECTNVNTKDSSRFDSMCPHMPLDDNGKRIRLQDDPRNEIESGSKTYSAFAKFLSEFTHTNDYTENWNTVAFTEYVQFFVPSQGGYFGKTKGATSARDFDALMETVEELKPDIIIIWGCDINDDIFSRSTILDPETRKETGNYYCHFRSPNTKVEAVMVNCYHPSHRYWNQGLEDFRKYFTWALQE